MMMMVLIIQYVIYNTQAHKLEIFHVFRKFSPGKIDVTFIYRTNKQIVCNIKEEDNYFFFFSI